MESAASEAAAEFQKLQEVLASMSGVVAPASPAPGPTPADNGPLIIPMQPPSPEPEAAVVPEPAAAMAPEPEAAVAPKLEAAVAPEPETAVAPRKQRPPEPAGQPRTRPPEPAGPPRTRLPPTSKAKTEVVPPWRQTPPSELLPQTSKASASAPPQSSSSASSAQPQPRVRGERRGKNLAWYQGLNDAKSWGCEKQYRDAHPKPEGDPVAREAQKRNIIAKEVKEQMKQARHS